jgi:hypothetical protein
MARLKPCPFEGFGWCWKGVGQCVGLGKDLSCPERTLGGMALAMLGDVGAVGL